MLHNSYMKKNNFTEKCKHNNRVIRTIEILSTVEKTAVFCVKCNKQLSKINIEV